ncbi:solute carrier family 2, facilitated glucose transporter member 7, partial [Camelus ferus]
EVIGAYSFIIFAGICLLTAVYIYVVIPETKGRTKGTLLINNVFAITPAILMGVSKVAKAFEPIVFSRVLLGVCAGISYSALPMYLGELAPKNLKGALGTMTEVFVIVGVFLAQIFSLQAVLGNPTGSGQPHPGKDWVPLPLVLIEGWNHVGVPALFRLLSLPFFPESPRYTLIQKKDEETARQALRKLRGWTDVEDEIEEMRVEDQAERAEGRLSVLNLFTFRPLRWQLVSIIVLMAGQQLSGVNAVNYYVDMIYLSTGVEAAHSQYVTVGAGVVNIVMTVISAGAVERLGRRRLLLVGYGICGSACLVLTLALLFQGTVPELSYLGIICVFAYIAGHSTGPSISYSALPMYLGELAPKNLKGALGTMTEVFVIVGVFLAQIFSLQAVLGNPTVTRGN